MGSMMTKQRTADYALHFATIATQIAREPEQNRNRFVQRTASDLVEDAGFIQALAQDEALLTEDPYEVTDYNANWFMALSWWNQRVVSFTNALPPHTQRRIKLHMEAFWDEA